MAYDEDLARRLREALQDEDDVQEKRMFGGLAFLLGGHMAVAASGQGGLLLRVDPAASDDLVREPDVARMVMQQREMAGWLHVGPAAVESDDVLRRWVRLGVDYVHTLPPK